MKEYNIIFNELSDVIDFSKQVSKLDCDIDLKYGSRICDAKSIMELMGLMPYQTPIKAMFNADESVDIEEIFSRWIIQE